jgi:two-component system cell cycle sensor histidine kinase/response regulator CckA
VTRVEFSLPEHLWKVEVDRGQMHQVFSNLFINAVQAMPHGGLIQIRAENLPMAAVADLPLAPGKYVAVTITDQGEGIGPENLKKIFDPYFTTKQKGSGLGLATVYAIITQHGGRITVDSQIGQGTTFHLWLPAEEGAVDTGKPAQTQPCTGHGRILVMDDEILVREVVGKMLRKLGYEPVFAQEGEEALALYAQGQNAGDPFTAVILDLTIPGGMGGMEALQHLLAQDPQVRALVSSGYTDHPIMASYQDYGFQGVIAKPYRISGLSEVLQKVIVASRADPGKD